MKVLILCTGNSCRSIIAEALINEYIDGVDAISSGVKASGKVNKNAQKVLIENEIWRDEYHSKILDEIIDIKFDLVVTVCDNALQNCPIFPKNTPIIHIEFDDPDGKDYSAFKETYLLIKTILIPQVTKILKG